MFCRFSEAVLLSITFHRFTIPPYHLITLSPYHLITLSLYRFITLSPYHLITLSPYREPVEGHNSIDSIAKYSRHNVNYT
jgi:hypothetical protein